MRKTSRLLSVTVLIAVIMAAVSAATPSAAGTATTSTGTATLTVVADGLHHPRGLVAGPLGILLIAEAGRAGEGPCLDPSPGTGNQPACFSATGAITLAAFGHQVRVAEGLPSVGDPAGSATSGPHDVAITPQGILVLFGYAHNPEVRPDLGADAELLGQLVLIDWSGQRHPLADLAAHELAHNPDDRPGFLGVWSNPYALLADGSGHLVVDSGGNTVLKVSATGDISTRAVLPTREVPAPPTGDPIVMESVPTGIARGPGGEVYVAELTGFPFPVGQARIFELAPGQADPQLVTDGFTNVIDLAVDAQGRLLVLELATNGLLSGNPAGALKRLEADGSITTLVDEGLIMPTKVAVAPDGAIYVVNFGTSADNGQVVRVSAPA